MQHEKQASPWLDSHNQSGETRQDRLQFLETLVNTIPVPLFLQDTSGHAIGCNHMFAEQILGKPGATLPNQPLIELDTTTPFSLTELHHIHDHKLLETPGVRTYEVSMQCADGVRRDFLIHKTTVVNHAGEVTGLVGIMLDISERKHLEETLEQRVHRRTQQLFAVIDELQNENRERERMNELLQHQADIIESVSDAIISTDLRFIIQSWNKAAEIIYGWHASDVVGKKVSDVLKTKDTGSRKHDILERFFAQGFQEGEVLQTRKDGNSVHILASASLLRNHRGEPAGMVAVHRDITERKRTEEALRQSEERYRSLVETSPDAIILTDLGGHITFCNRGAVQLFGYDTRDDMMGKDLLSLFAPDDYQRTGSYEQHRAISTGFKDFTYTMTRKDGNHFAAEMSSSVLPDADGHPSAFLCIVRDISERLQMEAMAIENARLNASMDLIAIVAHEVNTPLQTILSSLQLVRRFSDEKSKEFLMLAEKEIKRVGTIVTQLKDLYRPITEEIGPVDIHELLERVLNLVSGKLVEQRVQVERLFSSSLPLLQGRPDQLSQVFLNLIVNAINAMSGNGKLTVQTEVELQRTDDDEPETRWLVVKIRDTGVGIDPNDQEHIFEPFFTTREQGTGLGLFVSKKVMLEHGGRISVSSQPGQGTTFTTAFPIGNQG